MPEGLYWCLVHEPCKARHCRGSRCACRLSQSGSMRNLIRRFSASWALCCARTWQLLPAWYITGARQRLWGGEPWPSLAVRSQVSMRLGAIRCLQHDCGALPSLHLMGLHASVQNLQV